MNEPTPTDVVAPRAPLAREFTRFLLGLAIGVHRFAVYPRGHPSLEPAAEAVQRLLAELLRDRAVVRVGVARDRILMEGGATDPKHPVLSDLARSLHGQQIAGLSFTRGVRLQELEELLEELGKESRGSDIPLGLRPVEELPDWPHARIHPLGVERLAPGEAGALDGARATDLWMGLAAALLGEEASDAERAGDIDRLARHLSGEAPLPERVGAWLAQLVTELRATSGREAAGVRNRVAGLLRALDDKALERLVATAPGGPDDADFLRDANHALPPDVALRVIRAAARLAGRAFPEPMMRILEKLSAQETPSKEDEERVETGEVDLERAARPTEQGSTRAIVDRLLGEWRTDSVAGQRSGDALDPLTRAAPIFHARVHDEGAPPEISGPWRIVETALDVDAAGPTVEGAVGELLDAEEIGRLVTRLVPLQEDSGAARAMLDYLTGPERIALLLRRAPIDEEALDMLVARAGEAAVDPLLDVLAESESRALRRKVFDALAELGEAVGERAAARLEDPRWYVQRNMLALLRRLPELPRTLDPLWFAAHGDHRIRREAFPLALRDSSARGHALALGLADPDERMVRMALLDLDAEVPEGLLPTLVHRTLNDERSPGIRALAVRALRDTTSTRVRDALVEVAAPGRSFLGRPRLGPATADVVAALEVLRARWSTDPLVVPVLERARKSRDPSLRRAAGGEP